jgi:hypothetical protein
MSLDEIFAVTKQKVLENLPVGPDEAGMATLIGYVRDTDEEVWMAPPKWRWARRRRSPSWCETVS